MKDKPYVFGAVPTKEISVPPDRPVLWEGRCVKDDCVLIKRVEEKVWFEARKKLARMMDVEPDQVACVQVGEFDKALEKLSAVESKGSFANRLFPRERK